ncbi:MAG: sugar ABC transporter permease [Chloroflexi bacterium]|jgi:sn-glycerol 3-phosphate transport system permease protein|nr:sugar ABC transporter permease [Chloroflexota bacterium]
MNTRFPNRYLPYFLIGPMILVVLLFFIVPSAQSLYLSFFRVNTLGTRSIFVGFNNFVRLVTSRDYLNSMLVSLQFALMVVFSGLSLSLFVAVVANQRLRGFAFYRAMLIWPYALSPAIAGLVWGLMMNPNFGLGALLLRRLVGINFNYLTSSLAAIVFLALAATWKMFGYNIVFFLAGLQGLPTELLEAASLDGAGSWQKFWKVTFPLLSPTTFFLFIMNTLYAFFEIFGLVHITTQGGPGQATNFLVYNLYQDGFISLDTGFASAQSIVLLMIVASLTFLQFRFVGQRVHYL